MTQYARVIVDLATAQVDRLFDYILPDTMQARVGMRVKVPFGPRTMEGYLLEIRQESQVPADKLRPVLKLLDEEPVLLPHLAELSSFIADQYHCTLADALRLMIPAQMRGDRVREKTRLLLTALVPREELLEEAEKRCKRAPRQAELLRLLAQKGSCLRSDLPEALAGAVAPLIEKGLIEQAKEQVYRRPRVETSLAGRAPESLTGTQRIALSRITSGMGRGGRYLLHGVTGSGKTEVYLQAAQKALDAGQGVIILVPEISLTPQMTARILSRFGDKVAVLHSRLSAGERYDEWSRLRSGQARVAVGARSAIFAPVENLGLIVIDEEHESSYFSEHTPRYGALEVAEKLSALTGAALVAGSATPSVTLYHRSLQGEYELLSMPMRVGSAAHPRVHVVDMRKELAMGNRGVLSGRMVEELRGCLARGEQAVLFLNRRGFAGFVSCRSCGEVIRCDNCDVSMTYHHSTHELQCHYCGAGKPLPQICPSCGSRAIRLFGDGTEKLEQQLAELFPKARVLRMDADTTRTKDAHEKILTAFARGEAQILIGTQMIAKGLDFPKVTMVGVVAADLSLFSADGMGSERSFQLICQVCGRAGRGEYPGTAVVQTYVPGHYAVQAAAKNHYEAFFEREMQERQKRLLTPFVRVMRLVISSVHEEDAIQDLQDLHAFVNRELDGHPGISGDLILLEAMKAPAERIRGYYRYQLLVKIREGDGAQVMEEILSRAAALPPAAGSFVSLEVNPHSMM